MAKEKYKEYIVITNISATYMNCNSLVNIPTIPDSVTDAQYAFSGCNFNSINSTYNGIVNSEYMFSNIYNLQNATINFPNCTSISANAFYRCSALSSVTLPKANCNQYG